MDSLKRAKGKQGVWGWRDSHSGFWLSRQARRGGLRAGIPSRPPDFSFSWLVYGALVKRKNPITPLWPWGSPSFTHDRQRRIVSILFAQVSGTFPLTASRPHWQGHQESHEQDPRVLLAPLALGVHQVARATQGWGDHRDPLATATPLSVWAFPTTDKDTQVRRIVSRVLHGITNKTKCMQTNCNSVHFFLIWKCMEIWM